MDSEKIAASFFELSSEQRIQILYTIKEKPLTLSKLTESLGASKSEVHRNITRMIKSGLIQKDSELHFHLTLYGKTICEQISSLFFVPNNIQFFSNHTFGRILKLFKMTIINARYNRFFIFILVS
ncbi:MAG: ArsR family transcriptional regulator, partial [Crenarchaeota archaeon]|nr:ArsR family transcriptional regulator [Thermoproteota archaeon]